MLAQLVFLVFFHTIMADPVLKPSYDVNSYEVVGHHFEEFIKEHKKMYDVNEKAMRFQNFLENLKQINMLNEKHPQTTFGITKFTDMTKDERKSLLGFRALKDSDHDLGDCKEMGDPTSKDAPAAWDWREKGMVSPAKDQTSECSSCWAFSTTAMMESRYLQMGVKVILSEQQLVDCDTQSFGCDGGLMTLALTYLMNQGGQMSEKEYPYEKKNGTCRFDSSKIVAQVKNCSAYSLSGEDALKELLYKEGPLSVAVSQTDDWWLYKNGVFEECKQGILLHAVLLAGYGTEGGTDFWLIKNSYGEGFGDKGFIKIKRGSNCSNIADPQPRTKVSTSVAKLNYNVLRPAC